jgi:hypothetical protein
MVEVDRKYPIASEVARLAELEAQDGGADEAAFTRERLALGTHALDVIGKPIFWGSEMHSPAWNYDEDREIGQRDTYTSFPEVTRGLTRALRQDPVFADLYGKAQHIKLDYFKEGHLHGIFRVVFYVDDEPVPFILLVSKAKKKNSITRADLGTLTALESTGRVPKVHGTGQLSLDDNNAYGLLEYLPSNEISLHKSELSDIREFRFLEEVLSPGSSEEKAGGIPPNILGDKMMTAIYEVMFADRFITCVPQITRGDLVWMQDPSDPTNHSKGKVMLISTANVMMILGREYDNKMFRKLAKELNDIDEGPRLLKAFSMYSNIRPTLDSDRNHEIASSIDGEEQEEEEDPVFDEQMVYPYTALNLLNGLVDSDLDDAQFEEAFFALYYALRLLTGDGRKTRTNTVLTGFCRLFKELYEIWANLGDDPDHFVENLRKKLGALRDTRQAAFDDDTLNTHASSYGG